jgi:PAS domain-containing protein
MTLDREPPVKPLAWFGSVLAAAYLGALVAVSLGSEELVLPAGIEKRFCGAYLDCHLGVAVLDARELEPAPGEARHRMLAVRVRISNDARRARLALEDPAAFLLDRDGRRWRRSAAAERALGLAPDRELAAPLDPGEERVVTLAFELPAGVRHPRLHVRQGSSLERVTELLLIGDEDSLLHAPVTHAVPIDG